MTAWVGDRVRAIVGDCRTKNEAVRALKREGFRVLGRGLFSHVLALPEGGAWVVKVSHGVPRKAWNGCRYRDAWNDYMTWAAGFGADYARYAPRSEHVLDRPEWEVWVVERLWPLRGQDGRRVSSAVGTAKYSTCRLEPGLEEFTAATRALVEWGKGMGLRDDLHARNVMRRADGTPVISDPFVSKA